MSTRSEMQRAKRQDGNGIATQRTCAASLKQSRLLELLELELELLELELEVELELELERMLEVCCTQKQTKCQPLQMNLTWERLNWEIGKHT